ncbi:MAG: alpha-L-fucosidase C-terminal domain-containing protein, partial [Bacteroidota bacterium]
KKGHHSEGKNKGFTSKDFRFTTYENQLYAIALDWSEEGEMLVTTLAKEAGHLDKAIQKVSLLGSDQSLEWKQTDEGLRIQLPAEKPGDHAFVFKIELAG